MRLAITAQQSTQRFSTAVTKASRREGGRYAFPIPDVRSGRSAHQPPAAPPILRREALFARKWHTEFPPRATGSDQRRELLLPQANELEDPDGHRPHRWRDDSRFHRVVRQERPEGESRGRAESPDPEAMH